MRASAGLPMNEFFVALRVTANGLREVLCRKPLGNHLQFLWETASILESCHRVLEQQRSPADEVTVLLGALAKLRALAALARSDDRAHLSALIGEMTDAVRAQFSSARAFMH